MLGVCDRVADDLWHRRSAKVGRIETRETNVLQKDLENTSGLFVDETGDTLDTTSTSETTDGGLGDTLDVVAEDLAVTLGTALSETLGRSQQQKGNQ